MRGCHNLNSIWEPNILESSEYCVMVGGGGMSMALGYKATIEICIKEDHGKCCPMGMDVNGDSSLLVLLVTSR